MSKASTRMLEQGIQAPSPAPDLIPAETSTENLHRDWNYERGHIRGIAPRDLRSGDAPQTPRNHVPEALHHRDVAKPGHPATQDCRIMSVAG